MKIESFIFLPQTAINPTKVIVPWGLPIINISKVTIDVQIQNIRRFVHWIMPHFNGKRLIIKMN